MCTAQLPGMVTQAAVVAAVGMVGWRLLRQGAKRLGDILEVNKRTKQQLLEDWKVSRARLLGASSGVRYVHEPRSYQKNGDAPSCSFLRTGR